MFVRNFLSNGEYVSIVPVGILLTVQYDANGRIEKLIHGSTEGDEDVTKEFLKTVQTSAVIPRTIIVKGGRTWVHGVLYTKVYSYLKSEGILPDSIYADLKKDFLKNPDNFVFAAHSAKSLATVLRGSLATRQWLVATGFNILPGMPLSKEVLKEENFSNRLEKFLGDSEYFDFPLIAGYCVYTNGMPTYHPSVFRIEIVKKIEQTTDYHGNMLLRINDSRVIDYNEGVNLYDIQKGSALLIDSYGTVIYSYRNGLPTVQMKRELIKCPTCGNMFYATVGSPTKCTDLHCTSRLFIPANNMLTAYNLPNITYPAYQETVKNSEGRFSIVDILSRPEYDYQITMNIPTLLYGIIPRDVVADINSLVLLCNRCHNNVDNIMYQLSNPGALAKNSDIPEINRLVAWVRDERNVEDLERLFSNHNINIENAFKQFNGAPIFRNLRICITGDFTHGTSEDIKSIFASYSGKIVDKVEDANVVVVGGTQTNINGKIMKYAQNKGITIFDEYSFFAKYDIDSDLKSNLQ